MAKGDEKQADEGAAELPEWAARLRAARHAAGMSQEDLAARLGVKQWQISRWERARTCPSPRYREKLASLIGWHLDPESDRRRASGTDVWERVAALEEGLARLSAELEQRAGARSPRGGSAVRETQ